MNWRDFFYFSRGERRALIVLSSLTAIAWLALILTGKQSLLTEGKSQANAVFHPVCIYPLDSQTKADETGHAESPPAQKKVLSIDTLPSDRTPFYQTKPVKVEKYPKGTLVELNTADTLILKKVPGIGSAFSNRIIKYRNLLGGYYAVSQLSEVYGIDEERYNALKEWFCVNPGLILKKQVNRLPVDSLSRHPYINYRQAKAIKQLCKQKGKLSGWENLSLLEEFTEYDQIRVAPYFSFE